MLWKHMSTADACSNKSWCIPRDKIALCRWSSKINESSKCLVVDYSFRLWGTSMVSPLQLFRLKTLAKWSFLLLMYTILLWLVSDIAGLGKESSRFRDCYQAFTCEQY